MLYRTLLTDVLIFVYLCRGPDVAAQSRQYQLTQNARRPFTF